MPESSWTEETGPATEPLLGGGGAPTQLLSQAVLGKVKNAEKRLINDQVPVGHTSPCMTLDRSHSLSEPQFPPATWSY